MNEAESRRKETTPSTFTNKKVKTLHDEVVASNLEAESASSLKVDYGLAARTSVWRQGASHERSGAMGKVGAGEHRSSGKF